MRKPSRAVAIAIVAGLAAVTVGAIEFVSGAGAHFWRSKIKLSAIERKLVEQVRASADTDLGRMTYATGWVATSLSLTGKGNNTKNVTELLEVLDGSCTRRDWVMTTVAEALRIPVRRVGFINVPIQLSHSTTEIFADGQWRFFDATAGIYFSKPGDATPISITQARRLYPDITVWQTTAPLYRGVWSTSASLQYQPTTDNALRRPEGQELIDVERTYFASMMAGGDEPAVLFDLISIDLAKAPAGRIGETNQSSDDLREHIQTIAGQQLYTPLMHRIGAYRSMSFGRRLRFVTERPATVTFSIAILRERGKPMIDVDHGAALYGKEETAISVKRSGDTMAITFRVLPPFSTLSVWTNGDKSISVDSYAWDAANGQM